MSPLNSLLLKHPLTAPHRLLVLAERYRSELRRREQRVSTKRHRSTGNNRPVRVN